MNKRGFSWVTFLIVVICVSFVSLLVYLKSDAIKNLIFGKTTQEKEEQRQLGEKIEFSGELIEAKDLLNASHYIKSEKYGTVYLKSRGYNLFDYSGTVLIKGEVEDFLDEDMVLEVKTLVMLKKNKPEKEVIATSDIKKEKDERYSSSTMGIWFGESILDEYNLVEQSDNKMVFENVKKDKEGEQKKISISSFSCKKGNPEKDCEELLKTFEQSAERKIVNPITINFYKLSEIKSWFFVAEGKGYYINNANDEDIIKITNQLFAHNERYIKNDILENIGDYCSDEQVVLTNYDTYDISEEAGKKYIILKYNAKDTGKVVCKLELDAKDILVRKFEYSEYEEDKAEDKEDKTGEETGDETDKTGDEKKDEKKDESNKNTEENQERHEEEKQEKNDTNSESVEGFDTSVTQFPLKPEKALTFNSSRGHKIIFPSPSIAYEEVRTNKNFEQEGVNCFAQLNVVYYKNQEKVSENPDVEIYECKIKNMFDDSAKDFIYKKVGEKDFVIKINNPARNEFAHNIDIEKRE